jgi:hypothetical protein
VNVPVNIAGYAETLKAMKTFDEDLYKGMQKQIKSVMIPIRDKARGYAPPNGQMLSGWTKAGSSSETINYRAFPKYDQAETKSGITYNAGQNRRNRGTAFNVSYYVANRSAGGAIYETAGRKSGLGGRGTTHIVASRHAINKRYKVQSGTRVDNNSLNPNAGRQLMAPMGPLIGSADELSRSTRTANTGRLIFRAWAEDQGRVTRSVVLAIDVATKTFNATNTADKYSLAS